MAAQLTLFDVTTPPELIGPTDPNVTNPAEKGRISRQCRDMLALLRERAGYGVSNDELSRIARKYTSRITDLRKAKYDVECFSIDRKTGLSWYRLNP